MLEYNIFPLRISDNLITLDITVNEITILFKHWNGEKICNSLATVPHFENPNVSLLVGHIGILAVTVEASLYVVDSF